MDATLFTIGVGVFNTTLSGFAIWLGWRKDRRKVSVACLATYDGENEQICVRVRAVNEGHRPITITQLTVEFCNGGTMANQYLLVPNTKLPVSLGDGEAANSYYLEQDILAAISRHGIASRWVTPFAADASGRPYRGKKTKIPMNKFR